jgi:hypothetical protein
VGLRFDVDATMMFDGSGYGPGKACRAAGERGIKMTQAGLSG